MTLSPELTSCLQALKALLDLGDTELAKMATARLHPHQEQERIAQILAHFQAHRYSEAAQAITALLSEGTRLARWHDPEIILLEAELERVASDLSEAQAELSEIEHQIARFNAAFHQALGEQLAELLRLRMEAKKRAAAADPTLTAEFEQAKEDYEEFQQSSSTREAENARTEWNLTEDEEKELKRLYRQAAKKCHPDAVPPEHQAAATAMFRELQDSYETGNLTRLRQLAAQAEAGQFVAEAKATPAEQKASLQARAQAARSALEKTRADLASLKQSRAYRILSDYPDWQPFFEVQAAQFDQEIQRLKDTLASSTAPHE